MNGSSFIYILKKFNILISILKKFSLKMNDHLSFIFLFMINIYLFIYVDHKKNER